MKIFLGRLDPRIKEEDLEQFLSKFGTVTGIRLLPESGFGFAYMEEGSGIDELLAKKNREIDGKSFIVEMGRERAEGRGDRYSRGPEYDREPRRDWDDRSRGPRRCECDSCPIHGGWAQRRDALKIVLEGIGPEVHSNEVEDFVRDNGFRPTLVRTKGDYAFVGFDTVNDRDEGLKRLDGAVLTVKMPEGEDKREYKIRTRSFVDSVELRRSYGLKRRRTEDDDARVRDVYGDSEEHIKPGANVDEFVE